MGQRKIKIKEKKCRWIIKFAIFILLAMTVYKATQLVTGYVREKEAEASSYNIFDEMMVNHCERLRRSENMRTLRKYDPPYTYDVPFAYRCLEHDLTLSSRVGIYEYTCSSRWPGDMLYFKFYINDPEKGYSDGLLFAYRQETKTLYIFEYRNRTEESLENDGREGEGGLPLEELEYYRDYFLYEVIIGEWMQSWKSRYTRKDPGNFTIVDFSLPYEYCGAGCGGTDPKDIMSTRYGYGNSNSFSRTESYITWLDDENLSCLQQKTEYDYWKEYTEDRGFAGEELDGTWYWEDQSLVILADYYGTDTGSSRFTVQDKATGEICRLGDLVSIDETFIRWLKESRQVKGNLERTPVDREEGEKDTLEMLENCPEGKVREALEQGEFYIEPGYLHIRFPYWDYTVQEPGWVKNGDTIWKGWLTVRTEDIKGFLKAEPW